MNNEWVIAIVFFIVGLIPAYYFYKRGIRIKEPVYSIKSVNLVSDNVVAYENLAVTYKGGKIANFTVSKVLFFNRGAETLYRDNIDTLKHLKIVSNPASNILDARILQVNNLSSDFQISLGST